MSLFVDCPSGTHLAYNQSNSFCFELMSAADCTDMLTRCQNRRGPTAEVLKISNADVFRDVQAALT